MDIVEPLDRSKTENIYIIVLHENATRYPEEMPLKSIDAETTKWIKNGSFYTIWYTKKEVILCQSCLAKFSVCLIFHITKPAHIIRKQTVW